VNPHREPALEGESSVSGDVVGVRVRLENPRELEAASRAVVQILLDRVGRIDDDRDAGVLVTDEVGGTPLALVDELLEQHESDASNGCGYIS
jgi:hypothetical protein